MPSRLLPLLALGVLVSACGASAPTRSLEAYRIVSQSTDPANGQVVYHGVAEDGSGATVQIYGGQGQVAVHRGPAPLVRRAPSFRHRMWRRHAMRREAMRQRMAQRWHARRGRHHAHRGPHGPGCR